ncbi:hypothetical protein [Tenacibaculum caenipelagi]|uniref:Uncharacterized protein n=1 Tax=Tenacibaculum caenipelagi TaxID=1325435 RepID=A0A4R6TII2_9FLAO|nr:hypothetical protein [Tenacibaculum caenipelagi]TDQ27661.1 hypothetical protein DFQ07_1512 [Tenacibaculum caenipelagi]
MSGKAIKVIKEIRKREDFHHQRVIFCREQNMTLDVIKHEAIENELRRVCSLLQNEFETGYIN